ncbi:J domain-containing protein [Planctomonas psychrotolerans]|uniref:J domain-containing protein n=1 Tax=Planctomonas psychrotolerans TaxID=2528712 RepID=UPI00123B9A18|nr:DnaJ domain-containing protein [Planctomonas psychrotolerans]
MPESPASATPYEVLGVAPSAEPEQLRRAYRRLLRDTHPDTGGSAVRFHAVQAAWELVGDPLSRAAYDRGRPGEDVHPARDPARRSGTLRARSFGAPGARTRARYVALVTAGSSPVADPYAVAVVRTASREARLVLAHALAEEATADLVSGLGMAFTIWNDVLAGRSGGTLDHVVLGPAGLFALRSADWGCAVRLVRGELAGADDDLGETPLAALIATARAFERSLGVRFGAEVVVVPDSALAEPLVVVHSGTHAGAMVVRRSLLPRLVRHGPNGPSAMGYSGAVDLRARLAERIRFARNPHRTESG